MKIISAGEITIDRYIEQEISYIGGISLNFAVHARRCGAEEVSMAGCVGTDEEGLLVLQRLEEEGIDFSHVKRRDGRTATCDISVVDHAERMFPDGGYRPGVMADFRFDDRDLHYIASHDVIVSMYDRSRPDIFFSRLVCNGISEGQFIADFGDWKDYSGDPNPIMSGMAQRTVTFISGNEETVQMLNSSPYINSSIVVVTMGAAGSIAVAEGRTWRQPAVPVPDPVDSTGCGDAFQAAFSVHFIKTGNIAEALKKGAEYAAGPLQHFGAISQPALPRSI